MPVALVHPSLPLGIDGSFLVGRRDDLTIRRPETASAFAEAVDEAALLVVSNRTWDDAYLDDLAPGTLVQSMSAGNDRVPVDRLREREVRLCNQDLHGPTVAEHALALALALSRRLPTFRAAQRDHDWRRAVGTSTTDWAGKRLTVVGLGTIGEAVARRADGFGFVVSGTKRDPDSYDGTLPRDRVHPPEELADLLPETTVLVLAVPLTDETRGLVDAEAIAALPDDAVVINVARGPVLDHDALEAAIRNGTLGGAGLDVFPTEPLPAESPLWDLDRVIVTPHVAMHTDRFATRFADLVIENYDRWRADEPLRNRLV